MARKRSEKHTCKSILKLSLAMVTEMMRMRVRTRMPAYLAVPT